MSSSSSWTRRSCRRLFGCSLPTRPFWEVGKTLRIGQKPNPIEARISSRALVQENLRATPGLVSAERSPVGQIRLALYDVAQACAGGVAELEAGRGDSMRIAQCNRRPGNDVNVY